MLAPPPADVAVPLKEATKSLPAVDAFGAPQVAPGTPVRPGAAPAFDASSAMSPALLSSTRAADGIYPNPAAESLES